MPIQCKECENCGRYYDSSRQECDLCHTVLQDTQIAEETETLEAGMAINREKSVFAKRCPRCRTMHFLSDENATVTECIHCNNRRIAMMKPIRYFALLKADATTEETVSDVSELPTMQFTALRYGTFSFSVSSDIAGTDDGYLLGRSANQSEFLKQDGYVSNKHCYIVFREGSWYVKDNHSTNGTFVNAKDIGLNGERQLKNGDRLRLGSLPTSMEFAITLPLDTEEKTEEEPSSWAELLKNIGNSTGVQ